MGQRAEMAWSLLLSERGGGLLSKKGVWELLVCALSQEDLQMLKTQGVFINPIFGPASQTRSNINIPRMSSIITIDLNILEEFNPREVTAMILHEIGHALNPQITTIKGEFIADQYAAHRGYKEFIVSSLTLGRKLYPKRFLENNVKQRIEKLGVSYI